MMYMKHLSIVFALSTLLVACGGGGGAWDPDDDGGGNPADVPSAPVNLTANAGDKAISLGWSAPTTNGVDSITYKVTFTPASAASKVSIVGTTALIRGLDNTTTYTFSVTAGNGAGTGPAVSTQATPAAPDTDDYAEVRIDDSPLVSGGATSPSLLRTAGGQIWMAYSDVDVSGSGPTLRSTVRLAQSNDNGASYQFDQEVGRRRATSGLVPSGNWDYRTPWLIEDSSDPDATRRFKLFAHKYFVDSTDNSTFSYEKGGIAMWTAATPDGEWSDEEIVLGWAATPAILLPATRINLLDAALQACQWIDEGSASVGSDGIDMAFSCAFADSQATQRKIVLLRSADHAKSFSYIATLLQPADASEFSAQYFSMPALLPGAGTAPVLFASPIDVDGKLLGCVLFPIADPKAGKLFTESNAPLTLMTLDPVGPEGGGCSWDRSIPAGGILMGDYDGSDYTIQSTGKPL
jgi:hypothetical protein